MGKYFGANYFRGEAGVLLYIYGCYMKERDKLLTNTVVIILVRESCTEPVVRVMVEAPDHDTCQKYVSQVVETIKSRGYGA